MCWSKDGTNQPWRGEGKWNYLSFRHQADFGDEMIRFAEFMKHFSRSLASCRDRSLQITKNVSVQLAYQITDVTRPQTHRVFGAVLVYRYTGEFLLFSYPYMELWRIRLATSSQETDIITAQWLPLHKCLTLGRRRNLKLVQLHTDWSATLSKWHNEVIVSNSGTSSAITQQRVTPVSCI